MTSSSSLGITFSPSHSGMLILDSNLTVNGSSHLARAFLQILPGATDAKQLLVSGAGAMGGLAAQPATFFTRTLDSRGDASVSDQAILSRSP